MTLTDTQLVLLSGASQRPDGLLEIPDRIRGRARDLVAVRLHRAGLAEWVSVGPCDSLSVLREDGGSWALKITSAGLAALGLETPAETEAAPCSEPPEAGLHRHTPRSPRRVSKKLALTALLERPGGASLDELVAATGWLPHSARAFLTGLRRDGLCLTRARQPGQGSRYLLVAAPVLRDGEASTDGARA